MTDNENLCPRTEVAAPSPSLIFDYETGDGRIFAYRFRIYSAASGAALVVEDRHDLIFAVDIEVLYPRSAHHTTLAGALRAVAYEIERAEQGPF